MNKQDLIIALKDENGLTKSEAKAVVNIFFNEMSNALANGDGVRLGRWFDSICFIAEKKAVPCVIGL